MRFIIVALLVFALYPLRAEAGGFVADEMRLEVASDYVKTKAGRFSFIELGNAPIGGVYQVDARARNKVYDDVNIYICSKRDFELFRANQQNGCRGRNKGKGQINFTTRIESAGHHFLVIDNTHSLLVTKIVDVRVAVLAKMPPDLKQSLQKILNQASEEIQSNFQVKEFDFRIEPCGTKNAFSKNVTGDITICSELFFDLTKRKLPGALQGVIYHELGHTLLNLWGLPGWDSEETVDEFAIVMLYWGGVQEKALDWINFYAAKDSGAEAANMLRNDVRHPLSVQRIRNAKRILNDPREVISRWNKLLYPRMTKMGLQQLMETSPKYVDKALMQEYLARL
jgi:hypothetical protein